MDVQREIETIELEKGSTGCDSQHIPGDSGIFITRIKPGGAAELDGRLHVGDRVVSVNGETLIGVKHEDAVGLFRRTKGKVVLEVEKDAEKKLQENPNLIQRVDSSAAKTEATTSSGSAAAKTLGKSASNGNKLFSSSTKSDSSFSSSLNAQKLNPKRVQITPDSTPPKFSSGGAAGDSLERTPTPKSVSNAPSMSSLIDDVPKTPKKPMNRSRSHNKHLIEAGYGIVGVIAVAAIGWFIYRRYTAK